MGSPIYSLEFKEEAVRQVVQRGYSVKDVAERAGITSELQPFHALALGAQEVSPLDMASAYGTFAADGTRGRQLIAPAVTRAVNQPTRKAAMVVKSHRDHSALRPSQVPPVCAGGSATSAGAAVITGGRSRRRLPAVPRCGTGASRWADG